jgi:hypothetical protein
MRVPVVLVPGHARVCVGEGYLDGRDLRGRRRRPAVVLPLARVPQDVAPLLPPPHRGVHRAVAVRQVALKAKT